MCCMEMRLFDALIGGAESRNNGGGDLVGFLAHRDLVATTGSLSERQ